MNIVSNMVNRTRVIAQRLWIRTAVLIAVVLMSGGHWASAQIAEVQLNFPATFPTPFVGEITDELEAEGTRFGQFIFIYTNPTNQSPVEFVFTIDIDGPDGPLLTDIESDPAALPPGVYTYPPFSQGATSLSFGGLTTDEVLDMIGTDYLTDVVLSGVLAEGNYSVQIRVTSVDGSVPEAIGFTSLQILYPESAVLVAPGDTDEVTAQVPFFQWNAPAVPPGVQLEYEVLLVEMLEGQNPQEAIIGNRAHYEETFLGQTSFAYTPDLLPLAPGREYAWQVTTRDAAEPDRPFKDDGESEIYTFVYGSRELGAPVVTEPLRQAELTSDQVRFAWTAPANLPPGYTALDLEYEIVVVEALEGATAEEALLGGAPQHALIRVPAGLSTFTYGMLGSAPLLVGQTYAWQLRARDAKGDLEEGLSDPRLFTIIPSAFVIPEPVIAMSPAAGQQLTEAPNTLIWSMPGTSPLTEADFEVLIVEVPEGETPESAFNAGSPDDNLLVYQATHFAGGLAGAMPVTHGISGGGLLRDIEDGKTYAWGVGTLYGEEDVAWSAVSAFMLQATDEEIEPIAQVDAGAPLLLLGPTNGGTIQTREPTFQWQAVAENADVEVDYQVLFLEVPAGTPVDDTLIPLDGQDIAAYVQANGYRWQGVTLTREAGTVGLIDATLTVEMFAAAANQPGYITEIRTGFQYVWQVRARVQGEESARISPAWSFDIGASTGAIALVAPTPDAVLQTTAPTLQWNAVAENAAASVSYQVLFVEIPLGTDAPADFIPIDIEAFVQANGYRWQGATLERDAGTVGLLELEINADLFGTGSDGGQFLTALQPNFRYVWQVRARQGEAGGTQYSDSRAFDIMPPGDVVLISPDEGDEVYNQLGFIFEPVAANATTEVTYQVLMTEWVEGADRATLLGFTAQDIIDSGVPFYRSIHTYPAGEAPAEIEVAFDPEQMEQADYPNKLLDLQSGQQYFWQVRHFYDGYEQDGSVPPSRVFTYQDDTDVVLIVSPDEGDEVYNQLNFVFEPLAANATTEITYQVLMTEWAEGADRATLLGFTAQDIIDSGVPFYRSIHTYPAGGAPEVIEVAFDPVQMEQADYPNKLLNLQSGQRYFWQVRLSYEGYEQDGSVPPSRVFTYQDDADVVVLISPDEGAEVFDELSFAFESVAPNAEQEVMYQVLMTEWVEGADRATLLGLTAQDIIDSGVPFYRSIHTYPPGGAPEVIDVAFDPVQMEQADYPNKLLTLRDGQEYFWQVRIGYEGYVQDGDVPPNRVFMYRISGESGETALADVEALPVVEDVAELVDLDEVVVRRNGDEIVLSGDARLRVRVNGSDEPLVMPVRLNDLRVPSARPGTTPPTGGTFEGLGNGDLFDDLFGPLGDWFDFGDFAWSEEDGLNVPVRARRANQGDFFGDWEPFRFGADGLEGLFDFEDPFPDDGQPLFGFGDDDEGVSFGFDRFRANLGEFTADGDGRFRVERPELPACLEIDIPFENFDLGAEQAQQTIPSNAIGDEGCAVPLNDDESAVLLVERLGADLATRRVGFDFLVEPTLNLGGRLQLNAPFVCEDGPAAMELGETTLAIGMDGLINGTVDGLVPTCPMQIGPFTAEVITSRLLFETPGNEQATRLEGEARLRISEDVAVLGTFDLDLLTGAFIDYRFELENPFTLNVPEQAPVLSFRFNEAVYDRTGLMIDGAHELLLPNAPSIAVQFNGFTLDLGSFEVVAGEALFGEGFGLMLNLDDLAATAVPMGAELTLDPGLLFELGGALAWDANGFRAGGSMRALLNTGGFSLGEGDLLGTFSDDFAFGFAPFGVRLGHIDFEWGGRSVARLDGGGWNLTFDPLDFALPELLPLPLPDLAFLRLKDGDTDLVDWEWLEGSLLRLSTPNGIPFRLPGFTIDGQIPEFSVRFDELVFNPVTFELLRGGFDFDLPSGQPLDLSGLGIPFNVDGFGYGRFDGLPRLRLSGFPSLFGEGFDSGEPFDLFLGIDGRLSGDFNISPNLDVPLVPGTDLMRLLLTSISGSFDVPMLNLPAAQFDFDLDGDLVFSDSDGNDFSLPLLGDYGPGGATFDFPDFDLDLPDFTLGFGPFGLTLTDVLRIETFAYDPNGGFDFDLSVAMDFNLDLPDLRFDFSLNGLRIRPGGLSIPAQEVNDLGFGAFDWNGVRLEPLNFRWGSDDGDGLVFNWFNSQADWPSLPRFDFALTVPQLGNEPFTFYDVSFDGPSLSGSFGPFNFPELERPSWSIADGLGFTVYGFGASFSDDGGSQGFEIDLTGGLEAPAFDIEDPECPPQLQALTWQPNGGFTGRVDFTPCGALQIGPVTLAATNADAVLNYDDGVQGAVLEGDFLLLAPNPSQVDGVITGDGRATYDLLTSRLTEGSIEINDAMRWSATGEDSDVLDFLVNRVRLDLNGVTMSGESTLALGEANVEADFNNVLLDYDGNFVDGTITVTAPLGLEVDDALNYAFVASSTNIGDPNRLRLNLPGPLVITPDGVELEGEATASVHWLDQEFDGLRVAFETHDDNGTPFGFGLLPFGLSGGQIGFYLDDTRIARFDGNFLPEWDGLLLAQLPAQLALPSLDLAFLQLRDGEDAPLNVRLFDLGEGLRRLCTSTRDGDDPDFVCGQLGRPIDLVLPSLGDLSYEVTFDIVIDADFNLYSGAIGLDFGVDPPALPGLPLTLRSLRYGPSDSDGPYAFTADVQLALPDGLDGCAFTADDVPLSADGFVGTITAGVLPPASPEPGRAELENYSPGGTNPFVTCQLGDQLTLNGYGMEVNFDDEAYRFAGTLESPALRDGDDGLMPILYSAAYDQQWALSGYAAPDLAVNIGVGTYTLSGVEVGLDQEGVYAALDGVLALDAVAGGLALDLNGLRVGPNGLSFPQGGTVNFPEGDRPLFALFNDMVEVRLSSLSPAIQNDAIRLDMNGELWIKAYQCDDNACEDGEGITFNDLVVGTDGTLTLGRATLREEIDLIGEGDDALVKLTAIALTATDNQLALTATGTAVLPEPLQAAEPSRFAIRFDSDGVTAEDIVVAYQDGEQEFDLSEDIGTVELLNFGLDLSSIDQPALFANANIYLDPNDRSQVIRLGNRSKTGDEAGFFYALGGEATWNTEAELDAFKLGGLVTLEVNAFQLDTNDGFDVTIGGMASLALDGVEGGAGWQNLRFGSDGVDNWGSFSGEAAFTFMDVVDVTIGRADFGTGTFSFDDYGTQTEIDNANYFIFEQTRVALPAMGIAGGVQQVVYYTGDNAEGDRETRFKMLGAQLSLQEIFALNMSLDYQTTDDTYTFAVGGTMDVPEVVDIAVGGYISNDGGLSFGITALADADAEIPVVPGIIGITGFGVGLYYRPTDVAITQRDDLLASAGVTRYKANPPASNLLFEVMVYGGVNLFSGVMQGKAVATINDQFTSIDATGSIFGQTGNIDYGMNLTARYRGNQVGLEGAIGIKINYASAIVVRGRNSEYAEIEFAAIKGDGQDLVWAVTGDFVARITGVINADAQFMLSSNGFFMEVAVEQRFDFWVIDVRSGFTGSIWYTDESLGAYVEIGIRASLFGGAAKIGATAKGALIVDDGYLVYAAASAHVDILWVFKGRVGIWVALRNGNFDGGRGKNGRYEQMIADARDQASSMQSQMEQLAADIAAAENDPDRFALDPETQARAGANIQLVNLVTRQSHGDEMYEQMLGLSSLNDGDLSALRDFWAQIVEYEPGRPTGDFQYESAELTQLYNTLNAQAQGVSERLAGYQAQAQTLLEEVEDLAQEIADLESPVQSVSWGAGSVDGGLVAPTFTIDTDVAATQTEALSQLKASLAALDQRYLDAIVKVDADLSNLLAALTGSSSSVVLARELPGDMYSDIIRTDLEVRGIDRVRPGDLGTPELRGNLFGQDEPRQPRQATLTVNDFAKLYTDAMEVQSRFYVQNMNYLMRYREFAESQLSYMNSNNLESEIDDALNALEDAFMSAGNSRQLKERYAEAAKAHRNRSLDYAAWPYIDNIDGTNVPGDGSIYSQNALEATALYNEMMSKRLDVAVERRGFWGVARGTFREYWFGIHDLGLRRLSSTMLSWFRAVEEHYEQQGSELRTEHATFSRTLARVYATKADISTTMVGMIEEYKTWRQDALPPDYQDDNNDVVRALNLILAQQRRDLEPPVITSIEATPSVSEFANQVRVEWEADGAVESAYAVGLGSAEADMRSSGDQSGFTYWVTKSQPGDQQRTLEVIVQARSVAGVVATRRTQFNVAVESGYTARRGAIPGRTQVMTEDTTPPVITTTNLGSPHAEYDWSVNPYVVYDDINWLAERGKIQFFAIGNDRESDIQRFEAAIGNTANDTRVMGWTPVDVFRASDQLNVAFRSNSQVHAILRTDAMEDGEDYHLRIRAVNGEGLKSTEKVRRIGYDATPPDAARVVGRSTTILPTPPIGRTVHRPVYRTPDMLRPAVPNLSTTPPRMTVTWERGVDDETGFVRMEYAFSDEPTPDNAFADEDNITVVPRQNERRYRLELPAGQLSHRQTRYLHLRSMNHVGLYSDVTTVELDPPDPTPPAGPVMQAQVVGEQVNMYVTRIAWDQETYLQGYQFALGTAPGRSDVRGWPEDGAIDFATGEGERHRRDAMPLRYVREQPFVYTAVLPEGQFNSLYVSLRGVNGAGVHSTIATSGPITVDTEPPPVPQVSANAGREAISLTASRVYDPGTGVEFLEYAVRTASNQQTMLEWTRWHRFLEPVLTPSLHRTTIPVTWEKSEEELQVGVRLTDKTGRTTVAWTDARVARPQVEIAGVRLRESLRLAVEATDNLSGVRLIEVRVNDALSSKPALQWTPIREFTPAQVGQVRATHEILPQQLAPAFAYRIETRVTNADGGTDTDVQTEYAQQPRFSVAEGENALLLTYEGLPEAGISLVELTVKDLSRLEGSQEARTVIRSAQVGAYMMDNTFKYNIPTSDLPTNTRLRVAAVITYQGGLRINNAEEVTLAAPAPSDNRGLPGDLGRPGSRVQAMDVVAQLTGTTLQVAARDLPLTGFVSGRIVATDERGRTLAQADLRKGAVTSGELMHSLTERAFTGQTAMRVTVQLVFNDRLRGRLAYQGEAIARPTENRRTLPKGRIGAR